METSVINIGYINFIQSCVWFACVFKTPHGHMLWSLCVICCSNGSDSSGDSDNGGTGK
jgi:hypothetical protein